MPLFCYFRFSPFQICVYHFLMNWHLHVFEYSRNILLQQWKIMMWKLLKVRNKFVIILLYISIRTGLKPIEPIAPNWTRAYSRLFIYTLQVIQRTTIEPTSTLVFSCTHCWLYRERLLSPRLLSSVHVHTAGYTENDNWTPHLLRPRPDHYYLIFIFADCYSKPDNIFCFISIDGHGRNGREGLLCRRRGSE